jgi:hypothetical protein
MPRIIRSSQAMKRFKEILKEIEDEQLPVLDEVYISEDGVQYQYLNKARNWLGSKETLG